MKSWRKLRASQPELFADGAVGASQALNLVDFFAAAWTPDSLHAAALLQRAQIGVAAGVLDSAK